MRSLQKDAGLIDVALAIRSQVRVGHPAQDYFYQDPGLIDAALKVY